MDEFEKTLDRVLSDPGELEKLTRLAGQLFGGGTQEAAPPEKQNGGGMAEAIRSLPDLGGVAEKLGGLMGGGGGPKDDKAALIAALSPYLREDRRVKLQKAIRLARAARVAGFALNEFGGDGGAL